MLFIKIFITNTIKLLSHNLNPPNGNGGSGSNDTQQGGSNFGW